MIRIERFLLRKVAVLYGRHLMPGALKSWVYEISVGDAWYPVARELLESQLYSVVFRQFIGRWP